MQRIIAITAAALVMSTSGSFAAVSDWDQNQDQRIQQNEFSQSWDRNADFSRYDSDQSGYIDQNEWNEAGLDDEYEMSEWDTNADDRIGENEFQEGLFATYDENDDSAWDEEEYAAYENDDWF